MYFQSQYIINYEIRKKFTSSLKIVSRESISKVFPDLEKEKAEELAEEITKASLKKIEQILPDFIEEKIKKIVSRKVGW